MSVFSHQYINLEDDSHNFLFKRIAIINLLSCVMGIAITKAPLLLIQGFDISAPEKDD